MQIFPLLEISADYTEACIQLACSRLRSFPSVETLSRISILVISDSSIFTGKVSRSLARRVFHSRVSAVMPIVSAPVAMHCHGMDHTTSMHAKKIQAHRNRSGRIGGIVRRPRRRGRDGGRGEQGRQLGQLKGRVINTGTWPRRWVCGATEPPPRPARTCSSGPAPSAAQKSDDDTCCRGLYGSSAAAHALHAAACIGLQAGYR